MYLRALVCECVYVRACVWVYLSLWRLLFSLCSRASSALRLLFCSFLIFTWRALCRVLCAFYIIIIIIIIFAFVRSLARPCMHMHSWFTSVTAAMLLPLPSLTLRRALFFSLSLRLHSAESSAVCQQALWTVDVGFFCVCVCFCVLSFALHCFGGPLALPLALAFCIAFHAILLYFFFFAGWRFIIMWEICKMLVRNFFPCSSFSLIFSYTAIFSDISQFIVYFLFLFYNTFN